MTTNIDNRPLPAADALTEPYWAGIREHKLRLPNCRACGKAHFYPRSVCPHCGSEDIVWSDASGRGTVYSVTLVQRAPSPAFAADAPYPIAIVALEEGPHLMAGLTGFDGIEVRIGMKVVVDYLDGAQASLPVFRPAREGDAP